MTFSMGRRSNQLRQFKLCSPIVLDTDCLSSFLQVERGDLLPLILQRTIYVPEPVVYEIQELKRSKYSWIPDQLDELLLTDCYELLEFHSGDQVTKEWLELILPSSRNKEGKQLGSGEAAAMAWVGFTEVQSQVTILVI